MDPLDPATASHRDSEDGRSGGPPPAKEAVPVHDWQIEALERRKSNFLANPASMLEWTEVKRRIRSRHGR